MKNIVIVINNILLSGGTERATINFVNSIVKFGYKVTIISIFSNHSKPFFEIDNSVDIIHLKLRYPTNFCFKMYNILEQFITLMKVLRPFGKGNIIIGTVHSVNIFLSVIKQFSPFNKYIGCEHTNYDNASKFTIFFRKQLYSKLNALVVLTNSDMKKYLNAGINNVFVIPNQVSFSIDTTSDKKENLLLAIGRFSHEKGFDTLINVAKIIFEKEDNWKLLIIGDGPMKSDLSSLIKQNNLQDKVVLLPPQKNITEYYKKASIYLMTSRAEGFPMVLLEAKAFGLPIVAFDCPTGPAEIIKENDGFLIPIGDYSDFVSKTQLLMNRKDLRIDFGFNAKNNISDYEPGSISLKWIKLFERI